MPNENLVVCFDSGVVSYVLRVVENDGPNYVEVQARLVEISTIPDSIGSKYGHRMRTQSCVLILESFPRFSGL